jgi:hypothetical protein
MESEMGVLPWRRHILRAGRHLFGPVMLGVLIHGIEEVIDQRVVLPSFQYHFFDHPFIQHP